MRERVSERKCLRRLSTLRPMKWAFGWLLGILVLSILAILTQLFAVKKLLS